MCHKPAIEKFTSIMGLGNVVRENTPAENANFKQFRWSTSGANAVKCAKLLRPYLVVKNTECDVLLEWEPLIANGRNVFLTPDILAKRAELYERMKVARVEALERIHRED